MQGDSTFVSVATYAAVESLWGSLAVAAVGVFLIAPQWWIVMARRLATTWSRGRNG